MVDFQNFHYFEPEFPYFESFGRNDSKLFIRSNGNLSYYDNIITYPNFFHINKINILGFDGKSKERNGIQKRRSSIRPLKLKVFNKFDHEQIIIKKGKELSKLSEINIKKESLFKEWIDKFEKEKIIDIEKELKNKFIKKLKKKLNKF